MAQPETADAYASKKTIAKGFFDIALLSSNFKILITLFYGAKGATVWIKWLLLGLVIPNIILQLGIGWLLFWIWKSTLQTDHAGLIQPTLNAATIFTSTNSLITWNNVAVGLIAISLVLSVFIDTVDAVRQS